MSEGYGVPAPRDTATTGQSGTLEAAKAEASDLKDTAVSEAGHVADTAKGEAKAVAQEVKYQAKDLYAQTQRELKDQAQVQQHRVAVGLRSVSDELRVDDRERGEPGAGGRPARPGLRPGSRAPRRGWATVTRARCCPR